MQFDHRSRPSMRIRRTRRRAVADRRPPSSQADPSFTAARVGRLSRRWNRHAAARRSGGTAGRPRRRTRRHRAAAPPVTARTVAGAACPPVPAGPAGPPPVRAGPPPVVTVTTTSSPSFEPGGDLGIGAVRLADRTGGGHLLIAGHLCTTTLCPFDGVDRRAGHGQHVGELLRRSASRWPIVPSCNPVGVPVTVTSTG